MYHSLCELGRPAGLHSLSSPSTGWIIQDTSPLCTPDCTCKMEITSEVSSVKRFEIYWKKKKKIIQNKKPTTHTKWLPSFEFHENSACKLCGSAILDTPCSWLQYYYSTWSRWTQIIIRFLHNFSDFFTSRSQNILQKRQLMLFPFQALFMLSSPLSEQKAQAKQQVGVKVRNWTQEPSGLFCALSRRGNISQIEN